MGTEKRARQKAGTKARREAEKQAAARAKRRRRGILVGIVVLAIAGTFLGIVLAGREDESETALPPPEPVGAEVTAPTDAAEIEPDETTEPDETAEADNPVDPVDELPAESSSGNPDYTPYTAEEYGTGPCAPAEGAAERVLSFDEAPAQCIDPSVPHTAVFDTSRGTVRVELDVVNTPGTVNSFVNLARFGYYDDTLIHRSDPSIGILQGGSPTTNDAADPGPGYTLWDEGTGFSYRPGQLVMARRGEPNSAGAQYFFTVTPRADLLDGQGTYVVFGQVTEGLDLLVEILASHADIPDNPLGGAPDPAVVVNSVTIQSSPPGS